MILVSSDKAPDEFAELFDVEASNANSDPVQFIIALKNNRKWDEQVVRGGKRLKEARGCVQTARVEIIRHDPVRMAVEFPLVFTADDRDSQSTTFTIEHDLLSDATAQIIVDGFGFLPANSKLGFVQPVMFRIDLGSYAKPTKR
jgi:hypothetical protein